MIPTFNLQTLFIGNGASFLKLFERLLRGVWTPNAMEIMTPSLYVEF